MSNDKSVAPVNSMGNVQAIRYRLQKAFPQTAKVMPRLCRQLNDGQPWAKALDSVLAPLPPHQVERLDLELTDLFSMGWNDGEQFDLVMCSIFSLDAEVARRVDGTTWEFVRHLGRAVDHRRRGHAATRSVALADR